MKRYLTIFVLLCTISTVHGARFSYYAGGFRASYDVYAWNDPDLNAWSGADDDITYASVERTATVFQAYGHAYNKISSDASNNSICIRSSSVADGSADYSYCYGRGSGFGGTQNSQTYGIFYKIMPDANEQVGDDVMVYYNDMVSISSATGTNYVRIGGPGTMDHVAITRGQLPPVPTEPNRELEVLSFPKVEVSNSSNADWYSGIHAFAAKIGDVIGIFAQNSTRVAGWGFLQGSIDSTHTMILTVRPVLLGDLDHDDDVDFFDLAILANNWLVDVGFDPPPDTTPPDPDPVLWAEGGEPHEIECSPYYCATMTVDIATDPSGGVQYYFECTDSEFPVNSGWQGSPTWTVTVGPSGHNYRFRAKARDIHGNESIYWSTELPMN